jgi:hypothetical protein
VDAIIAALEVLLARLPIELALILVLLMGLGFLSRSLIEKQLVYTFNPKARLREQMEELQQDIQFTEDPKLKKSLTSQRNKLRMEYHLGIGKPLEVSKKWLAYSEVESRKEGFTVAELAMAKLYLGIDPLTGKPKITIARLHITLFALNIIGAVILFGTAIGLLGAAWSLLLNGSRSGLLVALFSLPFWYGVWRNSSELLDFGYVLFPFSKTLKRLLEEDTVLEQQEPSRLVAKDDVPVLKKDEGDKA